jgi:GNAT superfamily N-acetyltransferase
VIRVILVPELSSGAMAMCEAAVSARPATYNDFEAVAGMMTGFFAQHHHWHPDQFRPAILGFTQAIFQTWLQNKEELHLVAEIEARVIGYASASRWVTGGGTITFPRRGVHVGLLVVASEHRRKGAARTLFGAIEQWAAAYNAHAIGLNVSPANEEAKAFYAALGYHLDGEYRTKVLRRPRYMTDPA